MAITKKTEHKSLLSKIFFNIIRKITVKSMKSGDKKEKGVPFQKLKI